MEKYFDKDQSVMLAGIAILLMIWHHLFNFPDWYANGVNINPVLGKTGLIAMRLSADFGDICVQIFAIMSGYALYVSPKSYGSWKIRAVRLFNFISAYWMIYALFLLIGWLNDDTLPSREQLLWNLIGLDTGPHKSGVNVPFAWYVAFYIEFILLTPVLIWVFARQRSFYDIISLILLLGIGLLSSRIPGHRIVKEFLMYIHPIFCVGLGIVAAKYDIFYKIHVYCLKRYSSIVLICMVMILMAIKYLIPFRVNGIALSLFYRIILPFMALIMVSLSLELIHRCSIVLKRILVLFGTVSMYLWFLHGILFTGKHIMQVEVYAMKEPIVIFVAVLLFLTPIAYIIYITHTGLSRRLNHK